MLVKTRIDCILIWGHGLQFFHDILNDIRKNSNFEILMVNKYKPKNMKSFVKEIYSYDYAPFWHLKAKTKYLLKSLQEVCFIFVKNYSPCEDLIGVGSFRHMESLTLKKFKEELRDKYNPYKDGVRAHHHVIHATDSQEQAAHMMHFLGYKEGVCYFETENKFLDLPYYLKDYKLFEFKTVSTDVLFCKVINGESWDNYETKIVHVAKSPQFIGLTEDMDVYEKYINKFIGGPLKENYNLKRYKNIHNNFEYLKEPHQNAYVIVELIDGKYIILDGLHRASCHIYQGNKEIKICQISK